MQTSKRGQHFKVERGFRIVFGRGLVTLDAINFFAEQGAVYGERVVCVSIEGPLGPLVCAEASHLHLNADGASSTSKRERANPFGFCPSHKIVEILRLIF
jgi:hypothetical protein